MHAQSLSLFDVDASNFPTMKAKFYAFDAVGKQQQSSIAEISLTEDGIVRKITTVTCPAGQPPKVFSSVLVMDISASMSSGQGSSPNIEIAKGLANSWVNGSMFGLGECAITSFDHANYLNQDFTTDRTKLLKAISSIKPEGGTDYDAAFINSMAGGLRISNSGKFQKIIVFLTDGQPFQEPKTDSIILEATKQNCSIYCLTLGLPAPQSIKDIASRTGGKYFENITSVVQMEEVYRAIVQVVQGASPCEITWQSDVGCTVEKTNIEFKWNTQTDIKNYITPVAAKGYLRATPPSVTFNQIIPGIIKDSIITLTAENTDFTVIDIISKYGFPRFKVVNVTYPFVIPKNTSKKITLHFEPDDSSQVYAAFEIRTNLCSFYFSASTGFSGKKILPPSLKLTKPNGGEFFVVGSDAVITWDGVSASDTVTLEYSIDNGTSWKIITEKATGLRYTWGNVPIPVSNQCLVKITQYYGSTSKGTIPKIQWQRVQNGSGSDIANSVEQTLDGGYIVAGTKQYFIDDLSKKDRSDYMIVKYTSGGVVEWQKLCGGGLDDLAHSVQQAADGGYMIVGRTTSSDRDITKNKGAWDCWLVKLNLVGTIEWQNTYGTAGTEGASSIIRTLDGGYIIAGWSNPNDSNVYTWKGGYDYWILKLGVNGAIEWQKSIGGSADDFAQSIQQTSDGGYIVAGYTSSNDKHVSGFKGKTDYWIVKLNSSGSIEWEKTFGGSLLEYARSIKQTNDGGYIVAGYTSSIDGDVTYNHGKGDCWILKLRQDGSIEWQKSFGGSGEDDANSVLQTDDGGYIVAGYTESNDGDVIRKDKFRDSWLVKLSPSGMMEWQMNLGGRYNDYEDARSIQQTNDGGYIVAGFKGNYWIIKLSPTGGILQQDVSDSLFSIVKPSLSSQDIDMNQCYTGSIKDFVVQTFIQNSSPYTCRVDSITITGSDASQFALVSGIPPYVVSPSGSHAVEFRFRPNSVGIKKAQLFIFTPTDTLRQTILGEGIAPELVSVNNLIDFGKVLINLSKDTMNFITIKNIGSNQLSITATRHASPNDVDFTTLRGGGTFTLAQGETAKLDIRYSPKDVGRTSGRLLFEYNGVGSPIAVQLFGQGVLPDTARTTVIAQDITAQAGEKVNLTLKLQKSSGMEIVGAPTEWYARIHYNKSILYNVQTDNQCLGTTDSCMLELSGVYDPKSEDLITIPCITTLGNTDHSMIVIDTFLWMNSGILTEVATQNGTITLNGVCEDGGVRLFIPATTSTSLSTRPNPAQDNLQIHYGLREPLNVTLELLTMTGQVVQTILNNQAQAAGQYTLTSDLSVLGNGVYLLRLRTNKEILTTRVDVVK